MPRHIPTDSLVRPAETSFYHVTFPPPADPIGSLIRAYRLAGLSTETARLCAVADFECNFPRLAATDV